MKYETVKQLDDEKFRRLKWLKRATFNKIVEILRKANKKKKATGGRKNKLSEENMLLMILEYLREYQTYFHIAQNYGISESAAYKMVKWVEDTLIGYPDFVLPGRKELLKRDIKHEVLVLDSTEILIERPKKSKENCITVRRKNIHKKLS